MIFIICDLFPKIKAELKGIRFANAKQTVTAFRLNASRNRLLVHKSQCIVARYTLKSNKIISIFMSEFITTNLKQSRYYNKSSFYIKLKVNIY